jgi:hypothetical protein
MPGANERIAPAFRGAVAAKRKLPASRRMTIREQADGEGQVAGDDRGRGIGDVIAVAAERKPGWQEGVEGLPRRVPQLWRPAVPAGASGDDE